MTHNITAKVSPVAQTTIVPQDITRDVLLEKYCKGDETTEDEIFQRVAHQIASAERPEIQVEWRETFLDMMRMGGIGAGRIMASAGTDIQSTLINCFVQPIGDYMNGVENGIPGIYDALSMAAETMRRGGGVGYNFSALRPKGALVKTTRSDASGPCPYIDVFNVSCSTVESAGSRRGAQMGILNIDHPDIMEFVKAKRTPGRWNNFNVSVGVSDAFMQAAEEGRTWQLLHSAAPGIKATEAGAFQRSDGLWVYDTVDAAALRDLIMKSTYDYAEPGIIFLDRINADNNLWYCENIAATNPCVTGETLILTRNGNVRIDSVVDQETEVWNGFEWSLVTPKVTAENQPLMRIEFTDNTELYCTPYHTFLLEEGGLVIKRGARVEAHQLVPGLVTLGYKHPVDGSDVRGLRIWRVSKVDEVASKVYCFNEPKNHSGVFNGILTGNCGEQPLPPYGCCDLGPIILTRFVHNAFTKQAFFDMEAFTATVATMVRFLDNVLDVTYWPLEEQRKESNSKRRIGVGFTGLGDALIMMGLKYDSIAGKKVAASIAEIMRDAAYRASIDLAVEKGPFPLFNADHFLFSGTHDGTVKGTFASRLPEDIKDLIRKHGIRNSHLLSIAPTGTVSLAFADNASNGIEPAFSWGYARKKRMPDGSSKMYTVVDHALRLYADRLDPRVAEGLIHAVSNALPEFEVGDEIFVVRTLLPPEFVSAMEISAVAHLEMLQAVQPFIDSAISKTVNIPADYPFDKFEQLYTLAWRSGLKGLATYRPNDTLGSVLSVTPTTPAATVPPIIAKLPDNDPVHRLIDRRSDGELEAVTTRVRYTQRGGSDQSVYLSVSFADVEGVIDGKAVVVSRPIEVFIPGGQSDVPQEWISTFARQLSLNARSGLLAKALQDARQVRSDRGQVRYGYHEKSDGSRVPRWHDSEVGVLAYEIQQILFRRGFLDYEGNQVPAEALAGMKKANSVSQPPKAVLGLLPGKACKDCGAHAVIKKDGCDFCTSCGVTGTCG